MTTYYVRYLGTTRAAIIEAKSETRAKTIATQTSRKNSTLELLDVDGEFVAIRLHGKWK